MQRLTITHVARWQRQRRRVGFGHIYQGRFKSFPVSKDKYFYDVARYIERNAFRTTLVKRALDWRWSSLWRKENETKDDDWRLSSWPVRRPSDWRKIVSAAQDVAELKALRESIRRGRPYGPEDWVAATAAELGLEPSLRPRGRPRGTG
jgi:putative transposase